MKLGVFDPVFTDLSVEQALDRVVELGLDAVELGAGNYPGNHRCNPERLLADRAELNSLKAALDDRGLMLSALSCHGNPLHPDASRAAADDAVYRQTVQLAAELGVNRVNLFSGCPGDRDGGTTPNWVTCRWPTEFGELLDWQWESVVIPYWKEAGGYAASRGVRLGFEMHPGFVVYNNRTLFRLRDAVGDVIGTNLDPSHLFWQGIDPLLAIRELGDAIVHVHAKDTFLDPHGIARNGVLDVVDSRQVTERSWVFRSVGDGHDLLFWKNFVAALRLAGYDHVISIEHEDRLASQDEGLRRAVAVLRQSNLDEPAVAAWW